MQKIEKKISVKIFEVLSVENSVNSRKSIGGTSEYAVKKELEKAKKSLSRNKK